MKQCKLECWYLYPHRLTNREGYRCHCHGSCPAWCENCKHDCKIKGFQDWCVKFELKEDAPTEQ